MTPRQRLTTYLAEGRLMQLATARQGKPWVCTVYFVADDELNLYWLSWPSRRHSQEIAENHHVAITIVIKPDLPVIGVQAEGTATIVDDHATVERAMSQYAEKYDGAGAQFAERFLAGTNQHVLYRFTPQMYYIFDEVTYPNSSPQLVDISGGRSDNKITT